MSKLIDAIDNVERVIDNHLSQLETEDDKETLLEEIAVFIEGRLLRRNGQ